MENCKKETEEAIGWFLKSRLCVNKKKTEICLSHWNSTETKEILLGREKLPVLKEIKILGLILIQSLIGMSKKHSNWKILTSETRIEIDIKIFLWLKSLVNFSFVSTTWEKLWQLYSKMLRIVQKNWQRLHSFKTLHKMSNPELWSN